MNEESLQPKQFNDKNSIAQPVQKTEVVRKKLEPDRTFESKPDDSRSPTVQDRGGLETLKEAASKEVVKEPEVVRKLVIPTDS